MTSSQIRQSFLDFFKEKQHTIVPSSPLLPDAPNLLFTNAGMNQFVPIFLGQAPCPYSPARAADTQKCIRAGGKHNDLEDVGFDTYHHTFFEMLGNWSFGDYFKKEAIAWAWELVVGRWGFPASRIYATIYSPGPGDPASLDREAHEHWSEIFIEAGLDPAYHVVHGNKKDNFWMMGDTGPCGPCSELHVDLTPGPRDLDIPRQIAGRNLVNTGDARCIEIWNLVFIQFNANPDGTFTDLPAKHVDTGMGFERVTSMIQGTKGFTDLSENVKISNYETDVFRPLFDELEKITGKKYKSTLPTSAQNLSEDEKIDVAFRVIADHIRTLSFSIADGIQPSNEGRGYVLRRILRRAASYGLDVQVREPFLYRLASEVVLRFGDVFPELRAQQSQVEATIKREEEMFAANLADGMPKFATAVRVTREAAENREQALQAVRELKYKISIPAAVPLSQTLRENDALISTISMNVLRLSSLDTVKYVGKEGVEAQSHAKRLFYHDHPQYGGDLAGGQHTFDAAIRDAVDKLERDLASMRTDSNVLSGRAAFLLYDTHGFPLDLTQVRARERGMTVDVPGFEGLMEEQKSRGKAAQKKDTVKTARESDVSTEFVYDKYNVQAVVRHPLEEIAGPTQVSAWSFVPDKTSFYPAMGGQVGDTGTVECKGNQYQVVGVERTASGAIFHDVKYAQNIREIDGEISLIVDIPRRQQIEAHHSGTHLLNWALRKVLGTTVTQKGSYVGPDRLRFDFSHGTAVTPAELAEIERLVNEQIDANVPVQWEERPYAQVKGDPSILQFFGDKYGDKVRVVSIGDFSRELCGGTHVRNSAKVGYFKILHESAIAAGIRRIEAMSGDALRLHLLDLIEKQVVAGAGPAPVGSASREEGTGAGPAPAAADLWSLYQSREKLLHDLELARIQNEKNAAKKQEADFQKRAATEALELIASAKEINGVPFIAKQLDAPAAYLPVLADALKSRWQGVAVLAVADAGKVALLAAVAPAYAKKVQAGKIIQAIAPLVGGKGGGRPELAQGGGTNPAGLPAALAKAEELL